MSTPSVDRGRFVARAQRLYAAWNNDAPELGALISCVGSNEMEYAKNSALQLWLFGYELTDTALVFCKDEILIAASKKKVEFLSPLAGGNKENDVPDVRIITRVKGDDTSAFKELAAALKESGNIEQLGLVVKEKFEGPFFAGFLSTIKGLNMTSVDIAPLLGKLLASKDETEISVMKTAAELTAHLFNKTAKSQIINAIDEEKKTKHSKLTAQIEAAVGKASSFPIGVDVGAIDIAFPPIIQSGGSYSLKFNAESNDNGLSSEPKTVVLATVALRYQFYCAALSRTLLIDPTDEMRGQYQLLLDVQTALLEELRPGAGLADVAAAGIKVVKAKNPELVAHLTPNFGFATGLVFRESSLVISEKNEGRVTEGQCYVVQVGLSNLEGGHALLLSDTALVVAGEPAKLLTAAAKSKPSSCTLLLRDEAPQPIPELTTVRGRRGAVMENKLRDQMEAEEKRIAHQRQLFERLQEEAPARLKGLDNGDSSKSKERSKTSYKSEESFPIKEQELRTLQLYVDKPKETLIVPLAGQCVPFHISIVKTLSQSVEGDYTYLRINLSTPIPIREDMKIFVKELTFRASNKRDPGAAVAASTNLNTTYRLIKEMQARWRAREREEKEMEGVVEQESLVISNKSNPRLKELYMRPTLTQKRVTGVLEAHTNGFRYTTSRGDKVDVLYKNIKTAFFQPGDDELIILLHFHLRNPIMLSKKKTQDVQFYTEVGEMTTDLGRRQNMHDRDDFASEEAEREARHRLKKGFKGFCDKVTQMCQLEFDQPFKELGFVGNPARGTVKLLPTSGCLVSLVDWPPFVVHLDEIELVHMERVHFNIKNFDAMIVFKDYRRKPQSIGAISNTVKDQVQDWLDSCDIVFTTGVQTLNWPKIMKTISEDIDGFFETGGWTFLLPEEGDTDEDDDSEEEDETFKPDAESAEEGSGSGSSSESDESDSLDEDWSAEESGDLESDSDSEEGKDWSDLEKEAAKADAEHDFDDSDEDERRSKAKKSEHASSPDRKRKHESSHKSKHESPHKSGGSSHKKRKHDSPHKSGDSSHKKSKHDSPHKSSSSSHKKSKHDSPRKSSSSSHKKHR